MIFRTLILLSVFMAPWIAHAQYFMSLGPTEDQTHEPKFISVDDQGRVLSVRATPDGRLLVQRISTTGTVLWSKELAHADQDHWYRTVFTADHEGGLWCAKTLAPIAASENDTITLPISVAHVSAQGELTNQWSLHRKMIDGASSSPTFNDLCLLLTSSGSLVIQATGTRSGGPRFLDLYRLQRDGLLEWAKSVGDLQGPGTGGVIHPINPWMGDMVGPRGTPDGGFVFGLNRNWRQHTVQMDALGAITWSRSLRYLDTPSLLTLDDLAIDQDGTVHSAAYLALSAGYFMILSRINVDGDRSGTELCALEQAAYFNGSRTLALGADGSRYIRSHGGELAGVSTYLGPAGTTVAQHAIPTWQAQGEYDVLTVKGLQAQREGWLARLGNIRRVGPGGTDFAPTLELINTDAPSSCFDEVTTTAVTEVVPSLLGYENTNTYSSDLGVWVSGGTPVSEWSLTNDPVAATSLGCLTTGMETQPSADQWLMNNMVRTGEPLLLQKPMSGLLMIHTVAGALVHAERLNTIRTITMNSAAGAYIVSVHDSAGQQMQRAKVIVVDAL